MNIVKNDIDSLNAEIKISLGPADYDLKVSEGIKKSKNSLKCQASDQERCQEV